MRFVITCFTCWLVSYVITLVFRPERNIYDRDTKIGGIVLFLKSDKEFDNQYHYGIITCAKASRMNVITTTKI